MPVNNILIKLAAHCNFDCSYCYWFRDGSVRSLPKKLPREVQVAFLKRLERHLTVHPMKYFICSFHGGEPTLFGLDSFEVFLNELRSVGDRVGCKIRFALTTNGSLITDAWASALRAHDVSVTVSIDGPPEIHDARRLTLRGNPTWRSAVSGYLALRKVGIKPAVIAVCSPRAAPVEILDHIFIDLDCDFCDVLVPERHHGESGDEISAFYIGLFDHWFDKHRQRGAEVRILTAFCRGVLGLQSHTESIGFAATQIVCLNTTGQLEPHDALRISGADRVSTGCNVFHNEIADILSDPLWTSVRDASIKLCKTCEECRYKQACGGGHIAQRWSEDRQYDNVSVYCDDYQLILDHVARRLSSNLPLAVVQSSGVDLKSGSAQALRA